MREKILLLIKLRSFFVRNQASLEQIIRIQAVLFTTFPQRVELQAAVLGNQLSLEARFEFSQFNQILFACKQVFRLNCFIVDRVLFTVK